MTRKGYSIGLKNKEKLVVGGPGPGEYDPTTVDLSESPKHSFAGKYTKRNKENSPGPSDVVIGFMVVFCD